MERKTIRTAARLAVGLALSVGFLYLAFRTVDTTSLMQHLGGVDGTSVFVFVLCLGLIQACRIARWGILIRPFAAVSTPAIIRISNVGFMLILLLPLRLGEFARPILLKRASGASLSAGLGSVAVERAIDGLLVTVLFFLTTFNLETQYDGVFQVPTALSVAAYVALSVFGTATFVIIAALLAGDRVSALLRRLGGRVAPTITARLVLMLDNFISGLRALPDMRSLAGVVVLTLLYWAANGLGFYVIMQGFGWEVPPIAGFVVVCIVVLGIMIPAGPGNLGTYQAAVLMGLAVFGVDATKAAAFGLVVYPLTVLFVVACAVPHFLGPSVGLKRLVRESYET